MRVLNCHSSLLKLRRGGRDIGREEQRRSLANFFSCSSHPISLSPLARGMLPSYSCSFSLFPSLAGAYYLLRLCRLRRLPPAVSLDLCVHCSCCQYLPPHRVARHLLCVYGSHFRPATCALAQVSVLLQPRASCYCPDVHSTRTRAMNAKAHNTLRYL